MYRQQIYDNVIDSMKALIRTCDMLQYPIINGEARVSLYVD